MTNGIIVDCDPGVDDAIALLLAFGTNLPILGITTVAGNVPLPLTYSNARKICALANRPEVPVLAGCPRPLLRPLATAEDVHGATGLQGADLPELTPETPPEAPPESAKPHAVSYLIDKLLSAPAPVTIAALGPPH